MYFDFFDIIILIIIFFSCLFLIGYVLLKLYEKTRTKLALIKASLIQQQLVYPEKVKAIERFALFLERLKIENLIVRIKPISENVLHYKLLLNATIEQEFNHNAVQHIYISETCYVAIQNAKSVMVQQIDKLSQTENCSISEFQNLLITENSAINQYIITALALLKLELNN